MKWKKKKKLIGYYLLGVGNHAARKMAGIKNKIFYWTFCQLRLSAHKSTVRVGLITSFSPGLPKCSLTILIMTTIPQKRVFILL